MNPKLETSVADLFVDALSVLPGVWGLEWRTADGPEPHRITLRLECGCDRTFTSRLGPVEAVLDAARWYVSHVEGEDHEPRAA